MKISYDNARNMSLICPSISASSSLIPANEDISKNNSNSPLRLKDLQYLKKN